jgi:hypothetical protein
MSEFGTESVSIYVSDYDRFIVRFVGDEVFQVDHLQTVWTKRHGAPSQMMSRRVEDAIKRAREARIKLEGLTDDGDLLDPIPDCP